VDCVELNSYDIGGLLSAILRCVASDRICYILGAMGEGRRELREDPLHTLNYTNYIFIQSDEDVRTWLLSNQHNEDPLDVLVYCDRPGTQTRPATPPEPRHRYLAPVIVCNWANTAAGLIINRGCQLNTKPIPTRGTKASGSQNQQVSHLSLREWSRSFGCLCCA